MLLVRYQTPNTAPQYGYVEGELIGKVNGDLFSDFSRDKALYPIAEVTLLPPCEPTKIIGVVNNFADRLREVNLPPPELPILFFKPPSALLGHEGAIRLPTLAQQVEHAAELAVIIGKRARSVPAEQALNYVLGYAASNDVTARDLIERDGMWTRGKGFDTFCPLGPCIATNLDLADVMIQCRVNGETRQMSSTHDLVFNVPRLIAFISSIMTLMPGDVILTGAPSGVGMLAEGDSVEVEIEGIGVLRNSVKHE